MPMPRSTPCEGTRSELIPTEAPYLVVKDGPDLVLVAPFRKRSTGPNASESAQVRAVAAIVRDFAVWIDPNDGHATLATTGEGQLQRAG
jgi:hypothetical protein